MYCQTNAASKYESIHSSPITTLSDLQIRKLFRPGIKTVILKFWGCGMIQCNVACMIKYEYIGRLIIKNMFRSEENLTLKLTVRMKNIQKIKTGLNILTKAFPM